MAAVVYMVIFFLNCFAKSVFLVACSHGSFCCFIYGIGCVLTEISLNIWAQRMGSGVCILKSSDGCYWENHCSLRGPRKSLCGLAKMQNPKFLDSVVLATLASAKHSWKLGHCPTNCGRAEEWGLLLVCSMLLSFFFFFFLLS